MNEQCERCGRYLFSEQDAHRAQEVDRLRAELGQTISDLVKVETDRERLRAENERLTENQITPEAIQNVAELHRKIRSLRADIELLRGANIELRGENVRLRAALKAVADWDINWLDGLDSNVERIKTLVEDALRGEGEE